MEKTGRLVESEGNEHTERGNLLEPVVLAWAQKRIGLAFATDVMEVAPCGLLAANFDGLSPETLGAKAFIVEAKTTIEPGEWGDEGADQVPERVVAQTHHQFVVAGPEYRLAYVPVLMPGFRSFDFKMYRVERNDELANAIAERCRDFMTKHVRADVQPDDFKPSIEILKRVRRTPNKSVPISAALVEEWTGLKEAARVIEERKKNAEAAILAAMEDAEEATFDGGKLTYFEVNRRGYVVDPCTYRQLRLKAAKGLKA